MHAEDSEEYVKLSKADLTTVFTLDQFPRSAGYDPEWGNCQSDGSERPVVDRSVESRCGFQTGDAGARHGLRKGHQFHLLSKGIWAPSVDHRSLDYSQRQLAARANGFTHVADLHAAGWSVRKIISECSVPS